MENLATFIYRMIEFDSMRKSLYEWFTNHINSFSHPEAEGNTFNRTSKNPFSKRHEKSIKNSHILISTNM